MNVFLGIDIGTTNIKCLVLGEDGRILEVIHSSTPKNKERGVEFLDLELTRSYVESIIGKVGALHSLAAIAFSSFGETVIPVRQRKALSKSVMWYDRSTYPLWESHRESVDNLAPYRITGVENSYTFSLYKILLQKELFRPEGVENWLPVSSYLAYSLGGVPAWDMSQACRSFMVNIHSRRWNSQLIKYIGESEETMGELRYTGEPVGHTKSGIPLISAGHDHITGLYAAQAFARGKEFLFDSMGSASVIAAVVSGTAESLDFAGPFMPGGTVGIAYEDHQYYIESNVRYYGKLLQSLMDLTQTDATKEGYERLNNEIEKLGQLNSRPLFLVNGDLVVGEGLQGITLLEMPIPLNKEQLMQSAYIYLSSISKRIVDNIEKITRKELPIISGGGGSLNSLLMKYKASLLGKEIWVLPTSELTALGGAFAAAHGVGADEVIEKCVNLLEPEEIHPDEHLVEPLKEIYEKNAKEYLAIERNKKLDIQEG
ncbi:sugar kinase [Mesotoga sp. H07pep.5.4]|uniref:FGGY-family carbohydrate kinase n=1 Tax=Mesotoga sp. H07pep.5.4 TaxID=1463664 RepID=UPI000EF14E7D|nr:FGGY family carbohydrate kinase [Mesotoga sp. H07pep.5.4]RLL88887.1 sugar kinase [Mesotoga sp. H07pep.5.4]